MRVGAALVLALALGGPATAQELDLGQPADPAAILTIAPERLFAGTRFGQAIQAELDAAARALQEENRTSEAALAAEERALTDRRATMPPAEFRVLAEAFDAKANQVRETQTAKGRAIADRRDAERQRFFNAILPILGELMAENGAVAIIDRSTVFLSFDRIDITAVAIARIDRQLGAGDGVAAPPAEGGPRPSGPPPPPAP